MLSGASAARLPANLEPFSPAQVCVGRADVTLRGKPDTALTKNLQDALTKLAGQQNLGSGAYTSCPAWLAFRAQVTEVDGRLIYAATLSLVTPNLGTSALGNLQNEEFEYDGGFEFVNLWSDLGAGAATTAENLAFRLRAELVSQLGSFASDWKSTH